MLGVYLFCNNNSLKKISMENEWWNRIVPHPKTFKKLKLKNCSLKYRGRNFHLELSKLESSVLSNFVTMQRQNHEVYGKDG